MKKNNRLQEKNNRLQVGTLLTKYNLFEERLIFDEIDEEDTNGKSIFFKKGDKKRQRIKSSANFKFFQILFFN